MWGCFRSGKAVALSAHSALPHTEDANGDDAQLQAPAHHDITPGWCRTRISG
jgi:hypothetical protein